MPAVSVVGEVVVQHPDGFYSYDAKYLDEHGTEAPAQISAEELAHVQKLALRAFEVLECSGMARVDLFLKPDGTMLVNEINTIPGFTANAASRALNVDPKLSDAHMAMSQIHYDLEGNWTAAGWQINEALALDPHNADALIWASAIARVQSRFAQAIEYAQKAIAQDPLNAWAYGVFSNACLASGRLDDAESAWRKALKLAPTMAQLHFIFGVVQIAHRKPAEALEKMEEETNVAYRDVGRALALDALGRKNEADRALAVAEAKYAGIVEYPIAQVYAGRHEPDKAFVWLERAYQRRSGWVPWIPWDPLLNELRKDPRFTALLRKLNLPE